MIRTLGPLTKTSAFWVLIGTCVGALLYFALVRLDWYGYSWVYAPMCFAASLCFSFIVSSVGVSYVRSKVSSHNGISQGFCDALYGVGQLLIMFLIWSLVDVWWLKGRTDLLIGFLWLSLLHIVAMLCSSSFSSQRFQWSRLLVCAIIHVGGFVAWYFWFLSNRLLSALGV